MSIKLISVNHIKSFNRKKHREDLDEDLANLTLKEITVLDDPEDIYTAVTLSKDPEDTISNLTEEQRKKYQSKHSLSVQS